MGRKQSVDRQYTSQLLRIAQGHQPTRDELCTLASILEADSVQTAIIPVTATMSAEDIVQERCRIMQRAWPTFSQWWLQYFQGSTVEAIPVETLWRLYIPFSQWIVEQKSRSRPHDVYVVGVYGSQGRGKTVLSLALTTVLNTLLTPDIEGQAVTRSIDDYYLKKSTRETLRSLGYDAGRGVSNRGPAGTHDTQWLLRNIHEFAASTSESTLALGNFHKHMDDQPPEPFVVHGRVGVFILDGWFVGAHTDFDITGIPSGLQRIVAQHLQGDYKKIFDRLDALWAFDTPSIDDIIHDREQQEQVLEQRQGRRGMSPEQIRAFVRYFYEKAWAPGMTSPIPHDKDITFLGTIDPNRRIKTIERKGRPVFSVAGMSHHMSVQHTTRE